jgi:beta-glucosidase
MMHKQLDFPAGFLWGAASSAHQVEGNNRFNQWWQFEHKPGAIWRGDRSGLACDWWRNAEADFDRMQVLQLNSYRLSVEWSRVEPEPGCIDHAALDRYRAMLDGLHRRGIRPMVALHHFTNPRWFEWAGGWEYAEAIERFQRHVQTVVTALGDLCDFWLTLNEPLVYVTQGWVQGLWPPNRRNPWTALRVLRHLLLAHGAAYGLIHKLQPAAQVGYAHACHAFRGRSANHPLHRYVATMRDAIIDQLWVRCTTDGRLRPPLGLGQRHPELAGSFDFVGINYYTSKLVQFSFNPLLLFGADYQPPTAEYSDSGRKGPYSLYYPRGLYNHCLELSALGKPIYITENGLPDADDDQRPRWLLGHLFQLLRALRAGCDIRGYFHWTLVDNFEWSDGWGLRFGLFALDPATQIRTPRPSAALYGAIAQANAITQPMVAAYDPEALDDYFDWESALPLHEARS